MTSRKGSSGRGNELSILVPYRDRARHLDRFLPAIDRHLGRQLGGQDYSLLVVEQRRGKPFNRGKLLNVGFELTRGEGSYVCLHDVDLLPEDESCDYRPPRCPTQLALCLSQFGYHEWGDLFGGVTLFPRADFARVNGFSNRYWGWGGEDNDLVLRCEFRRLELGRRRGRYRSLWHPPNGDTVWPPPPADADPASLPRPSPETRRNRRRVARMMRGELDWRGDGLADLRFELRGERFLGPRRRMVTVEI